MRSVRFAATVQQPMNIVEEPTHAKNAITLLSRKMFANYYM